MFPPCGWRAVCFHESHCAASNGGGKRRAGASGRRDQAMEARNQNEGEIREATNGSRGDGAWETGTCQAVGRRWVGYGGKIATRRRGSSWKEGPGARNRETRSRKTGTGGGEIANHQVRGPRCDRGQIAMGRAYVSGDTARAAEAKTTLPQRAAKQGERRGGEGGVSGRQRIRGNAKAHTRA